MLSYAVEANLFGAIWLHKVYSVKTVKSGHNCLVMTNVEMHNPKCCVYRSLLNTQSVHVNVLNKCHVPCNMGRCMTLVAQKVTQHPVHNHDNVNIKLHLSKRYSFSSDTDSLEVPSSYKVFFFFVSSLRFTFHTRYLNFSKTFVFGIGLGCFCHCAFEACAISFPAQTFKFSTYLSMVYNNGNDNQT